MFRVTRRTMFGVSIAIISILAIFSLSRVVETQRIKYVVAPKIDPALTATNTPSAMETPVPGIRETLIAQPEQGRLQYAKQQDLSPEIPADDKPTLVIQHGDGSLEAIMLSYDLLDQQIKELAPDDLVYGILPPASSDRAGPSPDEIKEIISRLTQTPPPVAETLGVPLPEQVWPPTPTPDTQTK